MNIEEVVNLQSLFVIVRKEKAVLYQIVLGDYNLVQLLCLIVNSVSSSGVSFICVVFAAWVS